MSDFIAFANLPVPKRYPPVTHDQSQSVSLHILEEPNDIHDTRHVRGYHVNVDIIFVLKPCTLRIVESEFDGNVVHKMLAVVSL